MTSFAVSHMQHSGMRVPRWMQGGAPRRTIIAGVAILTFVVQGACAAEKPPLTGVELSALLANGLSVSATDMRGGKNFTGQLTYAPGGTLSGAITFAGKPPVAVSGTWKIDGSRLCRTIVPLQPQETCEVWLKSGDKEVTIRVGNTDVGMSRWQ